jgi:hypothetical protein
MWGLILKSLLQEKQWCNQILIRILGLGAFFTSKSIGCTNDSIFVFTACCLAGCTVHGNSLEGQEHN